MKVLRLLFVLVCVCFCSVDIHAQDGTSSLYFLSNLPQRTRVNPSYQPEYNVWIGLPALSGVSVNYFNSSFGLKDVLVKRQNDSLAVDFNKVYNSLNKVNTIYVNNENYIFTLGFRSKRTYITFDIAEKNDLVFKMDKGIFTFLKNGNNAYIGRNFELGGIGLKGNFYLEAGLGISQQINKRLTVGGRFKYLIGLAGIHLTKSSININTENDLATMKLASRQDIRFSGPVHFEYNQEEGYIDWDDFDMDIYDSDELEINDFMQNSGFGVDLGASYKFNDKLDFYASVLDIGFINWKSNTRHFTQDAEFDWKGADISNSINKKGNEDSFKDIDDELDDMLDSLKHKFRLQEGSGSFKTSLNTRFHLGATYQLTKMTNVGGLTEFMFMDKKLYASITASANFRFHRNLTASASYSYLPGCTSQVGAALTAKLAWFQLFLATDNLLAANYTSTQTANVHFGVNMLFGHKDRKLRKAKKKMRN